MSHSATAAFHTFEPYELLLKGVVADRIGRWSDVEQQFVKATSAFDAEFVSGLRPKGWYQSKARYFNDLIVAVLANAAGKPMATRQKTRSQLFNLLDIDVCYPNADSPIVGAEVKILGTPPHAGNDNQARGAKADLHKRIREVALTSIDFKVAHARPTPIGSFQAWVDSSPPGYFTFWGIRVSDESDFKGVRSMLVNLRTYCNGVGAIFFEALSPAQPTEYKVKRVSELDIDRNIREMAQRVA